MNEFCEIGKVIEIDGQKVIVEANQDSNDLTYFYNGIVYRGIMVGQLLGIIRGPYILVGRIEREFLVDKMLDESIISYNDERFQRKLDVKILGYLEKNEFKLGVIAYPMIYNSVIMLTEEQITHSIITSKNENSLMLDIGDTIKEHIRAEINAYEVFNTHIGIFGNTGSGKSNTFAKLYTTLFSKNESPGDKPSFSLDDSKFIFIDFNGEYVSENVLSNKKQVINLSTDPVFESDRLHLSNEMFWDIETLSILFSATEKTQKPFLKNAVKFMLDKEVNNITDKEIVKGVCAAFKNTFVCNNSKESNILLHEIYEVFNLVESEDGEINPYEIPLFEVIWNETTKNYYLKGNLPEDEKFISNYTEDRINDLKNNKLKQILNNALKKKELSITQRLQIAVLSRLIFSLCYGQVQFSHISPLIDRIKSREEMIDSIFEINDDKTNISNSNIEVISLRNCSTEAKKVVPLLVAKSTYLENKKKNHNRISSTTHLIIDEAHNILSGQSVREESLWKDYRLEVFEEIIKEGRKFGYYVTLSSQRPSDISGTIISQLHNYFIHRLISEKDMNMINNVINTLDSVSKSSVPNLAPGQCVITGTSFELPLVVQIEKLPKDLSPNSESANLKKLWNQK